VAEKTVNILQPTPEQELAWTRAGVGGHKLVWDPKKKDWVVRKNDKVTPRDITLQKWNDGQKTYTPITPGRGGALDVAEETARKQAEEDPLYTYVRDYLLEVVTDPKTNETTLKGIPKGGAEAVPFYLYLDSKGTINISDDYNAIKKKAIDDLKATNKLNSLFQELYNKKKISKATFEAKDILATDFNAALVDAINSYSKGVIGNRQFDPTATKAPDFLTFLQSGSFATAGGSGDANLPERRFQDISKDQLNAFIDSIYLETIGRKPTEEQRTAKMKELNKIVKAGIVTTTQVVDGEIQTRTKGGFSQEQQALRLQKELKEQNPFEYERRQAFGFMDELQKILSGGM